MDAAVGVQDTLLGIQPLHNYYVEVSDESCHKQKYHILCHERLEQSVLVKYVVHRQRHVPCRYRACRILRCSLCLTHCLGQYAFISLCLLSKVNVAIPPSLPLYNKAKRLCFPFFENNGVQLKLDIDDFFLLPGCQS